ncbi:DUF4097 family beta strand repeat-containing protein [Actinoplanes sp. NPDC023936]|uniref:DUF4097 family beta strand repeat-containing protein n=1 Tax=Actinoplanes sp. NPDC023936 TaxID=3154910 RepID=UPI0034095A89
MHTFDTTAPIAAVLDIPAGHIRFVAGDRTDTTVEIAPADAGKRRDVQAAEETTVGYDNGVLRIENTAARDRILGHSGYIQVTVQLPAGSRLTVKAADAQFRSEGPLADIAVEASLATVGIAEAGSARVTVAAGDVTVGRLTGPAEISATKGDIRITEAVSGTVVLTTQAGAITVGAARGVSAALDAGTSYGRITNSLRNDGTTELEIKATTAYGDIVARSL